jgi:hypothetical protein
MMAIEEIELVDHAFSRGRVGDPSSLETGGESRRLLGAKKGARALSAIGRRDSEGGRRASCAHSARGTTMATVRL